MRSILRLPLAGAVAKKSSVATRASMPPMTFKRAIGEALSVMLDRLLHADLNTLLRRNGP
jgi:hypothetical protein